MSFAAGPARTTIDCDTEVNEPDAYVTVYVVPAVPLMPRSSAVPAVAP